MKRLIKRLLSICLILILLMILGALVWWYRPFPHIDMGKISDSSAILQADIPSFSGSLTRTVMVNLAQQGIRHLTISGLKSKIIKIGIPIIFPQEIKYLILPTPNIDHPTFLLALDLGRAMRIVQYTQNKMEEKLFQGSPVSVSILGKYRFAKRVKQTDSSMKALNACVWMDSGIVASNDPEYLEKWVEGYSSKPDVTNSFKNSINIFIDNRSSFLTQKIRAYEKKYDYDIFSSMDQVASFDIQGVPKDPNTISGTIVFHGTTELSDDSPMVSDVNFFYGVLRRGLRPQGIEVKGQESHKGKDATLTLELTGFNTAISQIQNGTGEGQ
jgi:hypothetical protein